MNTSPHEETTRILMQHPDLLGRVEAAMAGPKGAELLDDLAGYIRRYVACSEGQAAICALWAMHTHAFDAADSTPYLAITSAEKQSGKSRLLEVLETVVSKPWFTGRVTAAVLTRKIDAETPSLLLDESDAAFNGAKEYAEALRGLLNTGHRRGGKASCCVGQGASIGYRDFSTYCPKAIAGIGKLPDTVADRSIPIRLKRAAAGEVPERFRPKAVELAASELRSRISTWCNAMMASLKDAHPELPDALSDRQQDSAEPLLAIAEAAGRDWPAKARRALVELCANARSREASDGEALLFDVRGVFDENETDRLPSSELIRALAEIETSPWGECTHGKPITPQHLAKLLRNFDIAPRNIRTEDQRVLKGYWREDFEDAWRRYGSRAAGPSDVATATPLRSNGSGPSGDIPARYTGETVAGEKLRIPVENGGRSGVADWADGVETEGANIS